MSNSQKDEQKHQKNILMMAAGTGGHVFPALAVARQLQAQGHVVHWLGTPQGMENRLLANEDGIPMHHVAMQGMRGNGVVRLLKTPFNLLGATLGAMKIIKAQKIDVVVGFGGYVAAPGGLAAKFLGKPLIIHEQNAIAGMTNSYLAKIATTVLEAFPKTFAGKGVDAKKIITVGNPIRLPIVELGQKNQEKLAHVEPAPRKEKLKMLVIGGSLGAQVLNENVPKALKLLDIPVSILHQCGRGHLENTQETYAQQDLQSSGHEYQVTEFVQNMAEAYGNADILVCRAGASTVSEVAVAGMPAIFVPLPHAVDDHQTANARFLSEHKAAQLLPQQDLNPKLLAQMITQMADETVLHNMQKASLEQGVPESTQLAVDAVLALTK